MKDNHLYIVLANSSLAKIYEYNDTRKITLLKTLTHDEASAKVSDLVSDEAGRYQKSAEPNEGSYANPTNPKDHEAELFARKLASVLNHMETEAGEFAILTAPKFQSLLKDQLNHAVLNKVRQFDVKDYTNLPIKDLEKRLSTTLDLDIQ